MPWEIPKKISLFSCSHSLFIHIFHFDFGCTNYFRWKKAHCSWLVSHSLSKSHINITKLFLHYVNVFFPQSIRSLHIFLYLIKLFRMLQAHKVTLYWEYSWRFVFLVVITSTTALNHSKKILKFKIFIESKRKVAFSRSQSPSCTSCTEIRTSSLFSISNCLWLLYFTYIF